MGLFLKLNLYFLASELCSWLLYYSLPVLKDILPNRYYLHFALLSTSIYMLLGYPVTFATLGIADKQLEEFYSRMEEYYGNLSKKRIKGSAHYQGDKTKSTF